MTSAVHCEKCNSYHSIIQDCLDAMRDEAHRLLREKSEAAIRHQKEMEKLKEALQFYADPKTYEFQSLHCGDCREKPINRDKGQHAREVLK